MTFLNVDWTLKLTSRKFWVAVIGFITPLLISFGFTDNQAAEVASIIMAGANMIAYIIGEGLVDSSRIKAETKSTVTTINHNTSPIAAINNTTNTTAGTTPANTTAENTTNGGN